MSPGPFDRPEPSTPSPKKQVVPKVDAIIGRLNNDYNLGVEVPDKTLSPSRRRERAKADYRFARFDKISQLLQQILFIGGESHVDTALRAFTRECKALSQKWMSKPGADCGPFPISPLPHKAKTPGEQSELQETLLTILEQLKQVIRPAPIALPKPDTKDGLRRERTIVSCIPSRPPLSSTPKRPSNDGHEGSSSKRVKEIEPGQVAKAVNDAPVEKRPRRHDPMPAPSIFQATSRSANRPFYDASANTSKTSVIRSIFSNTDSGPQSGSQSTVDLSLQEAKSSVYSQGRAPQSSAGDTCAPSSGDIRALDESFSHYLERSRELPGADRHPSVHADHETQYQPRSKHVFEKIGPGAALSVPELASSSIHSTQYSDFSALLDLPMPVIPAPPNAPDALEARLTNTWPTPPWWHKEAPLAVLWEFTRVCLHCGVDPGHADISYNADWANEKSYRSLWLGLRQLPFFASKSFPEPPDDSAWVAAGSKFSLKSTAVVLSASIDFNPSKDGPVFLLRLNPLRLEKGCRFNRRFGPDRFLEILVPSTNSKAASPVLKDAASVDKLLRWLSRQRHSIFGRQWAAFFVADAGYRKPVKEIRASPDAKPVYKERIHLFAERSSSVSPGAFPVESVEEMLDWLLQFGGNQDQSFLKLFSRVQLGLSKTEPVVILEQHQIVHRSEDIKSPAGKVMNDGIGRVSLSIARKVQAELGLSDLPSAIQGRIGSAKGMWIVDVHDDGTEDWIETYPSQRKWNCVQTDQLHRTLEVHGVSRELRPASLNLQFLPVLEDGARDKKRMRETIGRLMADTLHKELDSLKSSISLPLDFRRWVQSNGSSARAERVQHQQVPFLGGLPKRIEETMNFLLDGGFDPKDQKFLQDMAFNMQKQNCDTMKTKLNIRVGRSAYVYMVVDFWDILEEDEVHLAFSSKFQDPQGKFSDVLLHDVNVLVARSPAHLPSDIQKAKAVFKTELRALKDVIVFSAKGNTPLADKLSGGDYDGDKAWVCWEPDIADNFDNTPVANPPDLSAFLTKDTTTFGDLARSRHHAKISTLDAVGDMIERSFKFNMGQSMLGQCTNYKEKLCYHTGTVRDHASVVLSTLLSNLVDQSKQGIVFGASDWDRLRKHLKVGFQDEPAYKFDSWTGRGEPTHIIDHLKFSVVKKTIDAELEAFYKELNPLGITAETYDEDLVKPYNHFEDIAKRSASCQNLLLGLKTSLGQVFALWCELMGKDRDREKDGNGSTYEQKVIDVYDKWRAIKPQFAGRQTRSQADSKVVSLLLESWLGRDSAPSHELSRWSILKASMTFKLFHHKRLRFVWQIAGRQLQFIKALVSSSKTPGRVPSLVEPLMYAALAVDKKFVAQYIAMMQGESSEYLGLEDDTDGEEEDDA